MVTCTPIDFFDAISTWQTGGKLDGYCLLGWNTVWISRSAKVVAFIAAIPLIFDVIGEQRIQEYSKTIQRKALVRRRMYKILVLRFWRNLDRTAPWEGFSENFTAFIVFTPPTFAAVLSAWYITHASGVQKIIASLTIGVFCFLTIWPVCLILSIEVFIRSPSFVAISLWPVEQVLCNRNLCSVVRFISILLIAAAFILDILTS